MSKSGVINIEQVRSFDDIRIIRGVILILDKHGIIESLLYTAGDEGLDEKQLLEILEINQAKLSELISSYTSSGLIIQKFGSTYILTSKKLHLILNN